MKDEKIMKYVPKRLVGAIREAYHDSDGYWIHLEDDYMDTHMNAHVIHGYTINELREDLQNVERIDKDEKYETPDDIYFDEHNEARDEQETEEDLGYAEGDNEDEK